MEKVIDADVCKYNAIDLGLPSGLKWADRNVGAATPEAFGDYFAWGETKPRGDDWYTNNPYDWAHAPFNNGSEKLDESYFNEHKSEWVTDEGVLKSEYDAAHAIMGGSWRMPTSAEMQELLDGTNRSVEGNGMRFTSKTNGNSIFMPLAGLRYGSGVYGVGYYGYAWSSSLNADNDKYSHGLLFYNGSCADVFGSNYRFSGFVVRGVHE